MKRFLWLISGSMLLTINTLSAQGLKIENVNKSRKTEIGLTLNECAGFGFVVKRQIKPNTFLRADLGKIRYTNNYNTMNWGIGIEHRVAIGKGFSYYHGVNFNYGQVAYSYSNYSPPVKLEPLNISTLSIGYRLGIRYEVNKNLYIGTEINPQIGISKQNQKGFNMYKAMPINFTVGMKF